MSWFNQRREREAAAQVKELLAEALGVLMLVPSRVAKLETEIASLQAQLKEKQAECQTHKGDFNRAIACGELREKHVVWQRDLIEQLQAQLMAKQAQLEAALATRLPVVGGHLGAQEKAAQRDAFEVHAKTRWMLLRRWGAEPYEYYSKVTQAAWLAWQAALATRLPLDQYAARFQWLRHKHVEAYGESAAKDTDKDLDAEMADAKVEIASVKAGVDSAWIWS